MKRIFPILFLTFSLLSVSYTQSLDYKLRDGNIFDKGLSLEMESASTNPELKKLRPLIGNWNVKIRKATSDSTVHESNGIAFFYYQNRGHSVAEKVHVQNYDGEENELNTITFYAFNLAAKRWNIGIANSYSESVSIFDGAEDNGKLILKNAVRSNGGVDIIEKRLTVDYTSKNLIKTLLETSVLHSNNWKIMEERTYTANKEIDQSFFYNESFGTAQPNRVPESAEFDFLIGDWTAHQEFTFPNGQTAKWPSNGSGVYVLNGNAVMEHNWYEVDSSLPEAATTIVRLYNRVERRWECLYLTNRFNSMLYFGGRKEGDKIILTFFNSDNSKPSFSYFTFYDIEKDKFSWFAQSSTDRGKTFSTNWKITQVRKNE